MPAAEAPVEDADSVFVSGSGADAGALACRIYLDDVLVVEQISGPTGVNCVTHVSDRVDGRATEDGLIGDLVAVPSSGAPAPALPTDASVELDVEALGASTVDLDLQVDNEISTIEGVTVPLGRPQTVAPGADRVTLRASNFQGDGVVVRCRLSVGGVRVAQELSLASARCRTSLLDLGVG